MKLKVNPINEDWNVEDAKFRFYNRCKEHPIYAEVVLNQEKIAITDGNENSPKILLIGEAFGKDEAKVGKPFVGRSGQILRE